MIAHPNDIPVFALRSPIRRRFLHWIAWLPLVAVALCPRLARGATDAVNFAPNVYQNTVSTGWLLAGTGDFDGSGSADLLWFNATLGLVTVWSSTGSGFAPNTFQATVASGWSIAAIGDFDRDGRSDLLWHSGNTFSIWTAVTGTSGVAFQVNTYVGSVADGWALAGVGDFDGDHMVDLVWFNAGTQTFTIWTSNFVQGFTPNTYIDTVTPGWRLAGIGDFDGDGKDDLAWFNSGTFAIWTSVGGGAFLKNTFVGSVSSGWTLGAVRDFNGDGRKDLLWRNGNAFTVWTSSGRDFTANAYIGTVSSGWGLAGADDFDGDARADLIWINGVTFTEWRSTQPPYNTLPVGALDSDGICSAMTGWAIDRDTPSSPVRIDLYADGEYGKGGTLILDKLPTLANRYRPDHCLNGECNHGFVFGIPGEYQDGTRHTLFAYAIDTNANVGGSRIDLLPGSPTSFQCTAAVTPVAGLYDRGATKVYSGAQLTGIEFPVGPVGSGGIRQRGDGTRNEAWIVNGLNPDTFRPRNQGVVPNSFFAVRVQPSGQSAAVRALQTTAAGEFPPMRSLTFTGEYPIGTYQFSDPSIPIAVAETVLSPMIPGDLENSAIPTAIYRFKITNTGTTTAQVSLLATQQNLVGFDGRSVIQGLNRNKFAGYGGNTNTVSNLGTATTIAMTKDASPASLALTMLASNTTSTASWTDRAALYNAFRSNNSVTNPTATVAKSSAGETVESAVSASVSLLPGESVTVPVLLSWYFPENLDHFSTDTGVHAGMRYGTIWSSASDVDQYVRNNLPSLLSNTQLYHDTFYDSTLPQYLLDRVSASLAVLHTPVVFWAQDGFFGAWEGLGCCANMPNHVWHYAQAPARLWPEIGKQWNDQWLSDIEQNGLVPTRIGQHGTMTFDGQAGTILMAYRDFLNTGDLKWLQDHWNSIKKAMDYLVQSFDLQCSGTLTGNALTTLDVLLPTSNPWLGSLYLAATNATSHMAALVQPNAKPPCSDSNVTYDDIYANGRANEEGAFWSGSYYVENAPSPGWPASSPYAQCVIGNASEIDMLLGQWWSSQLGLGDIFDSGHTTTALRNLYANNHKENNLGFSTAHNFRDFVEETDASMQVATWPGGGRPANPLWYYDEAMTGFEYAAAATMIQRGLLDQGLRVVLDISNRYDGRLRADSYLSMNLDESGTCTGTCDGTGNPFGDDEAGKWYGRSMASWSLLLAAQGYSNNLWDGVKSVTFAPVLSPDNHRSFFTASQTWGTFQQTRTSGKQIDQVTPKFGALTLQAINLVIPSGKRVSSGSVAVNGTTVSSQIATSGNTVKVTFPTTLIPKDATLVVALNLSP